MDNKPALIQKIRFPNKLKKPEFRKGLRSIYLALGFVLGIVFFWGLNAWLNHRPEKPETAQVKERPVLTGKNGYNPHEGILVSYPGKNINFAAKFNDRNANHLTAAEKVGLKAVPENREAVEAMRSKMVPIKNSKNYMVDPLSHSIPYLCPGAARELDAIGDAWADLLKRNDLPHYKFILTSLLRTKEDVNKLKRSGNVNASENSAHCYGTTFDITYSRFEKAEESDKYMHEGNLKLALAQILLNEQRAGHIYVKYENKQACFHITSRL